MDLLATGEWTRGSPYGRREARGVFPGTGAPVHAHLNQRDDDRRRAVRHDRPTQRAWRLNQRPVSGARPRRTSGARVPGPVAAILALVVLLSLHTLGSS